MYIGHVCEFVLTAGNLESGDLHVFTGTCSAQHGEAGLCAKCTCTLVKLTTK